MQSPSEQREDADVHSASDEYRARFSGEVGAWMLSVQEVIVREMVARRSAECDKPVQVLDVGGGHGQIARPLSADGAAVTVYGSGENAATQIHDLVRSGRCNFECGDLLSLPYDERQFDVVTSFRLLPHCGQVPALVSEMCRVAKSAVIVDYPVKGSVNALAPLLFGAKKGVEKNTRPFTLFWHREVVAEFNRHGFELARYRGQFFFPMVLHRALKCAQLSIVMERLASILGLTALFGSPIIAEFQRKGGV